MSDFRARLENLSPKRLMLLALELQSRLEARQEQSAEPIAIIGLGCRFPGAENGPEEFWSLLREGRSSISEVPPDRWDADAYYDADVEAPGRMATKWGGFLAGIDQFDAGFFGIARREANGMDPQQRLLLEVCWEALENSGYSARKLSGSQSGVFIGFVASDYQSLLLAGADADIDGYLASGTSASIAAGRISYTLGLHGPAMVVDTACSSSLVSVHLACQSLRSGESRLALAGGVNAILSPVTTIALSKAHMMAPDGQCKAFDSRADGFVRSEGCGIVVLKRLSDAVSEGDRILAVIRGSAVNQDGRSSGLTAPNGTAQEALIRAALSDAGVKPCDISYLEAHGTGTALGDPIEAHALAAVLGEARTPENPLVIGSLKTNVGHLEGAAGVGGLIKTVLAMQHEYIPPHLHFHELNPHIDWGGVPVEIPANGREWRRTGQPRLAGVSSFGFSGTNAHVVLEEAPQAPANDRRAERDQHVLAISARSEAALVQLAERYDDALAAEDCEVADLCHTANAGRSHFEYRLAAAGSDAGEIRAKLKAALPGRRISARGPVRPVFLFPGQGAQYAGMGKRLYATQPVFRATIEECSRLLQGEWKKRLEDVLWGDSTNLLNQTAYTQPALFAIEFALARLWRSWGVEPSAVLGHSVGEYVAACVSGVYSLSDGIKLIAHRGRLMQSVAGEGAMAAVWTTEARAREAIDGLSNRVDIAALNAPSSVVISGYAREVEEVCRRLADSGVRVQPLAVSHAFHSPQMEEIEEAFEQIAAGLHFEKPRVRLISSVTGKSVTAEELGHPDYWRRQLRQPVRFAEAMKTLREAGSEVFLEVGPGSTLAGLGQECIGDPEQLWLSSLRSRRGEWEGLLASLGELYTRGAEIDWAGFDEPYSRRKVSTPTYPFQHQRYWAETARAGYRRPEAPAKPESYDIDESKLGQWCYRIGWEPRLWEEPAEVNTRREWLLVGEPKGFAQDFAERMRLGGTPCQVVETWTELKAALGSPASGIREIVDLRCLDTANGSAIEGCELVASLVRDLARENPPGIRLWIATRGAQATGRESQPVLPWLSPVWGLGRTIAFEHSEFWGGLIDLDPGADAKENADMLARHLLAPGDEDQTALRGGARLAARLERSTLPESAAKLAFRPEAAYLITGAFGGLGLEIARWMVRHGARKLVLMGRTALPARREWASLPDDHQQKAAIATILEIEKLGASIEFAFLDVGDEGALKKFFENYSDDCRAPIRGVIHAAGVVSQTLVSETTADDFRAMFRPKVNGGWLLHEILETEPLDFFVLFSSASAVLSWPRLGPYAAANAFLDGLAEYRRSKGLPALSMNWGAWSETGMLRRTETLTTKLTAERGMGGMKTAEGLHCLGRAIANTSGQLCILPVDWQEWGTHYASYLQKPFFSKLDLGPSRRPETLNQALDAQSLQALRSAAPEERKARLIEYLIASLAPILRVPADTLDATRPITDFGLDSLMGLEFRNRINTDLGAAVTTVQLLQGPRLDELAEELAARTTATVQVAAAAVSNATDDFPLSFGQQEHWFGHKIMPGSPAFNIGFSVAAAGRIEWSAFERAVAKLTERHTALRTIFLEDESGVPYQRVLPRIDSPAEMVDATAWSESQVKDAILADFQAPLALDRAMFCVKLYRCAEQDVLFFKVDHIIIDHWSARVWLDDLRKIYAAEQNGAVPAITPAGAQYRDFVEWERNLLQGPEYDSLWGYWSQKLAGDLPVLKLSTANRRSPALMAQGRALRLAFDSSLWAEAQRVGREFRATGYSFLLTVFEILLYGYTGQEDIVIGTSSSGREDPRWEQMIGLFINLLPLRAELSPDLTFSEYLLRVRDTVLGALAHQAFPFSLLVQKLRPPRSVEHNPVFQAFFNFLADRTGTLGVLFEGIEGYELEFGRSQLRPHMVMTMQEIRNDRSMFSMNRPDVIMQLAEVQGQLAGYLNFNSDHLDPSVAEAMAADYVKLLRAVVRNPNARIADLASVCAPPGVPHEQIVL